MELNLLFKEKNRLKISLILKGSGDLRVRPHPAKLPTCENELKKSEMELSKREKELMKSLRSGVVLHTFNPHIQKADV